MCLRLSYAKVAGPSMDNVLQRLRISRADAPPIAMGALIIGFVYLLYYRFGQIYFTDDETRSALEWMISRWKTGRRTYGHVYQIFSVLVPAVSLWIVWKRRAALHTATKKTCMFGWFFIVLSIFAHWVGVITEHPRLSLLSFIFILWSIPLFLYGWGVARLLIFPCSYLIFCVPLNFLDGCVFKVRMLVSKTAALIMNGLGMECVTKGTIILSVEPGGYRLELQGTAAGLGVVLLCLAVAAAVGNLTQRGITRQFFVFFCAIPAYFLASVLLAVTLGLVAGAIGQGAVDWLFAHVLTLLLTVASIAMISLFAVLVRRFNPLELLHAGRLS